MSKIIRRQRICKRQFKLPASQKLGPLKYPSTNGTAIITDITHERGRGAPLVMLKMLDTQEKVLTVATEGNYIGQKLEINTDTLEINNCVKLKCIPEGTVICNVERVPKDGGRIAVSSGSSCILTSYNKETDVATIKMPSGHKSVLKGSSRCFIGIVAGGGRTEKPLLKAGRAFYKYKSKGIYWPRVRGVAMNPVDHPHGGGNHQHIGHPSTISRNAPIGMKVGQIAARRTGLRKGSRKTGQ